VVGEPLNTLYKNFGISGNKMLRNKIAFKNSYWDLFLYVPFHFHYWLYPFHNDIQDSLKFLSRMVPIPKFQSIDVIMTSYLQKLLQIFC